MNKVNPGIYIHIGHSLNKVPDSSSSVPKWVVSLHGAIVIQHGQAQCKSNQRDQENAYQDRHIARDDSLEGQNERTSPLEPRHVVVHVQPRHDHTQGETCLAARVILTGTVHEAILPDRTNKYPPPHPL